MRFPISQCHEQLFRHCNIFQSFQQIHVRVLKAWRRRCWISALSKMVSDALTYFPFCKTYSSAVFSIFVVSINEPVYSRLKQSCYSDNPKTSASSFRIKNTHPHSAGGSSHCGHSPHATGDAWTAYKRSGRRIFARGIHIVSFATKSSVAILVPDIAPSFIYLQTAFFFQMLHNPDTLIFGGISTGICTWSGQTSASMIVTSFQPHSSLCFRNAGPIERCCGYCFRCCRTALSSEVLPKRIVLKKE